MSGGATVRGDSYQRARRHTFLSLGQFTANTTVTAAPLFGAPLGCGLIRILGIHVAGSAIPSDPDGTMLLNAIVNDISEGADDTIVSSADLETLLVAANQFYEATLATETSEFQLNLFEGDTVRFTLVNNSVAISTNPNVTVCVEWIPIPDDTDEDLAEPVRDLESYFTVN